MHALIRVNQGEYALADVGSRTGMFVNGELEFGVLIGDGSTIILGSSELFFSQVGDGGEEENGNAGTGRGVLLVRSGSSMGQSFQVGRGDFTIGRKPAEGGIQIDDPTVSQRHALIRCMSRVCRLYDIGSANGTKVDGVVIQGVTLHNGDILRFGEAGVQFVHEESPG